jgi:hypothetical protein
LEPAQLFQPLGMLDARTKERRLTITGTTCFRGGKLCMTQLRMPLFASATHSTDNRLMQATPGSIVLGFNFSPKGLIVILQVASRTEQGLIDR